MRDLARIGGTVLSFTLAAWSAAASLPPADSTKLFLDQCSACHSIGGGDLAGPDLLAAAKLPEHDLEAAVKRMEANVGPMTDDQVEGLVDLLRDPAAKARIAGTVTVPAVPVETGSAANGRRLFYGESRLQNRGAACFACHAAAGEGGNLAADLTIAYSRLGDAGVLAAEERLAFPMMKGAYTAHSLSHTEAVDIAAFLRDTARNAKPGTPLQPEKTMALHGTATGVAVAVFAAVVVVFRSRRTRVLSERKGGGW